MRNVSTKDGVVVMDVDGTLPFNTWYCRRAVTISGIMASSSPIFVAIQFAKAALFGASMVMFFAAERVLTNAGCAERRADEN